MYFFQPARKLGAVIQLSGKAAADGPLTIRLQPCGTAVARLINAKSQPLTRYRDENLISMIVTPGPDRGSREPADASRLRGEAEFLARLDLINYPKEPESDPAGRITFPALIPGVTYRIVDHTTVRDPAGPRIRKDFIVGPGETLYLGDILIEKPSR